VTSSNFIKAWYEKNHADKISVILRKFLDVAAMNTVTEQM